MGQVHVQWRCAFEEEWTPDQEFVLRRARLRYEHSFFTDVRTEVEVGFDDLTPELKDAFVEYRVTVPLRFTAGLHKMPFSREELIPVRRLKTAERTHANQAFSDAGYLGRDIGLTVAGDLFEGRFPVSYAAGAYNGNRGRLSRDDNNAKQFAQRLTLDPLGWLSVGLNASQRNDSLTGLLVTAWGGDVEVAAGAATVAAELLFGEATPDTGMLGLQLVTSWRLGTVEPCLRLEWFDPDRTAADDEELPLTAGFTWYLHRLIHLKTNLIADLAPGREFSPVVLVQAQAGL
jgi:hypothetical protein